MNRRHIEKISPSGNAAVTLYPTVGSTVYGCEVWIFNMEILRSRMIYAAPAVTPLRGGKSTPNGLSLSPWKTGNHERSNSTISTDCHCKRSTQRLRKRRRNLPCDSALCTGDVATTMLAREADPIPCTFVACFRQRCRIFAHSCRYRTLMVIRDVSSKRGPWLIHHYSVCALCIQQRKYARWLQIELWFILCVHMKAHWTTIGLPLQIHCVERS